MSAEDSKQLATVNSVGLSVRVKVVSREPEQAIETLASLCKKFGDISKGGALAPVCVAILLITQK